MSPQLEKVQTWMENHFETPEIGKRVGYCSGRDDTPNSAVTMWFPEKETLSSLMSWTNVSREEITLLFVRDWGTSPMNFSSMASACSAFGFPDSLPNLSFAGLMTRGVGLNIIRCLTLFAPRLTDLVLQIRIEELGSDKVGPSGKSFFHKVDNVHLITPPLEREVANVTAKLLSIQKTFPKLRTIGLGTVVVGNNPVVSWLHDAMKAKSANNSPLLNVDSFEFEGDAFQKEDEGVWSQFCNGGKRVVRELHLRLNHRCDGIRKFISACGTHLNELHLSFSMDPGSRCHEAEGVISVPPLQELRRLKLGLYDCKTEHELKYQFLTTITIAVGGRDTFPSLNHLVLDISVNHERDVGNNSVILGNEGFFSQLGGSIKELTILPKGLQKGSWGYLEVMKKFAIWFPHLSNLSLDLVRLGVTDLGMMRDEFVP